MQAALKEKKKYILLVLALIVHLVLLAFLFLPRFQPSFLTLPFAKKTSDYQQDFPTIHPDKQDWAARQTPAPTIFFDDDTDQQVERDEPTVEQEPLQEPIDTQQSVDLEMNEHTLQEFPINQPANDTIRTQAIEPIRESSKKELPAQSRVAKPTRKPRQTRVKKELKLADITQSFMERMHNVPVGQLFMQGNINNMPPDKQIIFERYRTKLGAIVAQVVSEHPYPLRSIPQEQLHMYLELDRQGRFKDLHLVQSCGVCAADDYALFIYSQASKRFPPIPESLDIQLFKGILRLNYCQQKAGERQNKNLFLFD